MPLAFLQYPGAHDMAHARHDADVVAQYAQTLADVQALTTRHVLMVGMLRRRTSALPTLWLDAHHRTYHAYGASDAPLCAHSIEHRVRSMECRETQLEWC